MADLTQVERQAEQTDTEIGLLLERVHFLEEDTLNLKRYYEAEISQLRRQLATYEDYSWLDGLGESPSAAEFKLQRYPAAAAAAANPSTYSTGLLSLPTEIIDLICQYAGIKSCLQPGRRLYIPPSCYYCTSFPLFEVPCPGLLSCCRELHRRLIPFFYENSAVVVKLDLRRCDHENSFTKLMSRASIHPYIHNVDLTLTTSARDRASSDPQPLWRDPRLVEKYSNPAVYCRVNPEEDLGKVINALKANLPNLQTFSWTIKIRWDRVVSLSHTEADDGDSGYTTNEYGPPFLNYYRSPFSILEEHLPGTSGHNFIPSLRVWLARSAIHKIAGDLEWHIRTKRGMEEPILKNELVSFVRQLPPLAPIIKLFPHIGQFDFFHGLGWRSGFFAGLKRPWVAEQVMQMATSLCNMDEFDELEVLETLLKAALSWGKGPRFWRRAFRTRPLLWCHSPQSVGDRDSDMEELSSTEDQDEDLEALEDSSSVGNHDQEPEAVFSNSVGAQVTATGQDVQARHGFVYRPFPSLIVEVYERVYELF